MSLVPGASGSPAQFASGISRDTTGSQPGASLLGAKLISTVLKSAAISQSNNTPADILTLPLTAGNWLVMGTCGFSGTATPTFLLAEISTVANTRDNPPSPYTGGGRDGSGWTIGGTLSLAAADVTFAMPVIHIPTSGVTLHLVVLAGFSSGTCLAYGHLEAIAMP